MTMITGSENIERARWLTVRGALKLEIHGLTRRGRSARMLANEITGKNCRTRVEAYEALNDHIVAKMGDGYDRPLPAAVKKAESE